MELNYLVLQNMTSRCIYYTEECGKKYFRFEIKNDKNISISKNLTGKDSSYSFQEIMIFSDYKKAFIGYDQEKNYTIGYAILVHIDKKHYYFIGSEFYSFEAKDEIIEFDLLCDKNGMVYPYAIDLSNNIYLMKERISFLSRNEKFGRELTLQESNKNDMEMKENDIADGQEELKDNLIEIRKDQISNNKNPYDYYYDKNVSKSFISKLKIKQFH